MSAPRTETGKRLFTDNDPMDMWESDGVTPDDIAAVEDEAVAAERARLVAGVEKLLAEHVEVRGKSMEPDPEHPGLIRQTAFCRWCAAHRPDEDPRWQCEAARVLALIRDTEGGTM